MRWAASRSPHLLLCCAVAVLFSYGEARRVAAAEVLPEQDDASLRAVDFLGPRTGWAAGDRGVIWRTLDGGQNWTLLPSPSAAHWTSLCFLTDRIGWIAGGRTVPYTHQNVGTLMTTRDGGETWQVLVQETWPRFHHVQFFDLENGVAVCDGSPQCPSGILTTADGGQSWIPAAGENPSGWRAAAFASPSSGIVCGMRGAQGYVTESTLQTNPINQFGLRGLHAVCLNATGQGWLVGDGGTVQRTENGGVSWALPDQSIPKPIRDSVNFRAVAGRDSHVWIVGSPGSVVLHSSDGGRSWETQPTPQPTPLHAIEFVSERHGFAVGDLGRIVTTADGGQTWTDLRGGDRRLALLSLHVRPNEVSLPLTVRTAGEQGYRSGAVALSRPDIGGRNTFETTSGERLRDALLSCGGATSDVYWRLPVTVPDLETHRDRLLQEWSLLTEQRLGDVILGELVTTIRTWRPDVIVLNEPATEDVPAQLLDEALHRAITLAADAKRYPDQERSLNLSPWAVAKVFRRLPSAGAAPLALDPHEVLPRLKTTLRGASVEAAAILHDDPLPAAREGYQLSFAAPELEGAEGIDRALFSGLSLPPGSAARRALPALRDVRFEEIERIARTQRQFDASLQFVERDPLKGSGLLAQLNDSFKNLPPAEAAQQLALLARHYRQQRDWSLTESTYSLLIDLFPEQPVANEGARWLLSCWSSQEVAWQRAREGTATQQGLTVSAQRQDENLRETFEFLRQKRTPEELELFQARQRSPLQIEPAKLELTQGDSRSIISAAGAAIAKEPRVNPLPPGESALKSELDQQLRQRQAGRIEEFLRKASPTFLETPETQFALAAHWRQTKQHGKADRVYDKFLKGTRSPWHRSALGEVWLLQPSTLSPKPAASCRRTPAPPLLDGRLDDACWSIVRPIPLLSGEEAAQGESFVGSRAAPRTGGPGSLRTSGGDAKGSDVSLAYDDKYLYIAARIPKVDGLPTDAPEHAGRAHDEDLRPFDRVSLFFDIDRDYGTSYRFDVDQRGHTRESCWEDQTWNPKWHVASAADDTEWRFEAAIPLEELVPETPRPGTAWGVGLVRTMPALGVQAWTHPAGDPQMPETFGLLRFE